MTTQKNTLIKLETKSQLAKLIATENITIQHNQVKTASFDTLNRVLTLPIFKVQSGDVYDMLIAHECSHALFTPAEGWKQISDDDSLRQYVNVLEDTRIDLLIQKKYPGVVKNYLNGFDIMEKQNFFGLNGKDINTDLMLIDKINIRSKSMNRLPFNFSKEEQQWLQLVDDLKTFDDVVKLAKDMLAWQKKRIESLKKLPDFDDHPFNEVYGDHDTTDIDSDNSQNNNANSDDNDQNEKDDQEQKEDGEESNAYNEFGAGGEGGVDPEKLIVVTNESYEKAKDDLLNTRTMYNYFNLPKANLKNVIVSSKQWNDIWDKQIYKTVDGIVVPNTSKKRLEYVNWLNDKFKAFKNDNKKTVMYLVKEFEMKKSATAYKRATTDKTGTIDPLKLKDYKFSDDIFKRLTITPDAKNHGMMMLLDWSGSMCDNIQKTIEQLMNLVWFCDKINIPYEVYLFTSEMDGKETKYTYLDSGDKIINDKIKTWNYKNGDGFFSNFNLVNVASHKMKKRELDKSLTHLFHMGLYYNERYTYRSDREMYKGDRYSIPDQFWLGTTPLNEALVVMNELIPMFKRKYNIEKMTFITLTDGASNSNYGQPLLHNDGNGLTVKDGSTSGTPVITINKKQYKAPEHAIKGVMTEMLLKVLQEQHKVNTIGFYVVNHLRRMYDLEGMIGEYKDWNDKQSKIAKVKSQFTKEKCADVISGGYNKYFLLNGKDMKVENTDLSGVNESMTSGKIKQLFSKSMKGRIVSRSLLNKFIKEVA